MFGEILLAAWTLAGLSWWIIALVLVLLERRAARSFPTSAELPSLTIFKPLPPLGEKGMQPFAAGLRSFASQLDSNCEMIIGVREADRALAELFLGELRAEHPGARIEMVVRVEPDRVPNPKVAGLIDLAAVATGDVWLWSDADILAPAGFLQTARTELEKSPAKLVTFPYVIRAIPNPAGLLETLFVNVELYPGILFLRRKGMADFGLGAGMIFRANEFRGKIDWNEFGAFLADDFQLGQRLQPVQIGTMTLETLAGDETLKQALLHDIRWSKTIRWNKPAGSFARILILPVAGWLMAVAVHPSSLMLWLGLLAMIELDVFFAMMICGAIGCRLGASSFLRLQAWSLWRVVLWVICRLPGGVIWSGRKWSGPRAT